MQYFVMKKTSDTKKTESQKKPVSRRSFLKGAGVTTAGTVALGTGLLSFTSPDEKANKAAVLGPDEVSMTINVNGKDYTVVVEPRTTLAEMLREELHLTGTKVGCDRGACSACTVLLDDKPICSCLTLALDVEGKSVLTVEGLAENGKLHPVQEAFIEHDATMCGFCTPGMVMSCTALLKRNPNPTLDDVKEATSGNFCRCGTHPKVFEAALAAARK